MRKSFTNIAAFFIFILVSNAFADRDQFWKDALTQNWKPVRKWLKHSETPREDLRWIHDSSVVPVLDMLLDFRKHIRAHDQRLYARVFGEEGLVPWTGLPQDSVALDAFLEAALVIDHFRARLPENMEKAARIQKVMRGYRKLLSNTFTLQELNALTAIYQDPDFQILIKRCEALDEEISVPDLFKLEMNRFEAVSPFVAALEIILPDSVLDLTDLDNGEHYMAMRAISDMLLDFSNERIDALTQKLSSPVYRREIIKRHVVFGGLVN